jgi:hypothetical protein
MLFFVVGAFLLLATLVALCYAVAVRNHYLLVLTGSKFGPLVLERQESGRYALISNAEVPLALVRFFAFSLALAALAVWLVLRAWVQALVPSLSRISA